MKPNLKEVRNAMDTLIKNDKLSYQDKGYLLDCSIITLNGIRKDLAGGKGPCDMCIDIKAPEDRYCKYCGRKLK